MRVHNSISGLVFTKKFLRGAIVISVVFLAFSGCGSPQSDDALSPALKSVHSWGGCDGGEQDQFIAADLEFDKNISIAEDAAEQLRVTVGGERIKNEEIDLSVSQEHTLRMVIPVEKVTSGVLKIAPLNEKKIRGITDESGNYSVKYFTVDTLVPSGVELSEKDSGEGMVSAEVMSPANHRSIVWIRITADGEPVVPDGFGSDVLKKAFAVHEHDFLWATEESTAGDIAGAINRFYPDRLTAEAQGSTITVRSVSRTIQGTLGIEIFTY